MNVVKNPTRDASRLVSRVFVFSFSYQAVLSAVGLFSISRLETDYCLILISSHLRGSRNFPFHVSERTVISVSSHSALYCPSVYLVSRFGVDWHLILVYICFASSWIFSSNVSEHVIVSFWSPCRLIIVTFVLPAVGYSHLTSLTKLCLILVRSRVIHHRIHPFYESVFLSFSDRSFKFSNSKKFCLFLK